MSRSGYYKWLKNKERQDKDVVLRQLIQEYQQKAKYTYGYRRAKLWLCKKHGLHVDQKRVLRVMRKYGLLAEIRRPNEKWVSDISYIHTKQGILYLAVIKDLFDHSIVVYETGPRQDNGMVSRLIEKAKRQIRKGTLIHSDQGGQYSSKDYFLLSEKYRLIPSNIAF